MQDNIFMTWGDWEAPNAQLRCLIQELVCGLDCNGSNVTMNKANNGFITFSGPQGTLVFKEGGVSNQVDNSIIEGTDGLAYFKENITNIDSIGILGSNLTITYTNETGLPQTKAIPLTDICTACATATIDPLSFISTDADNGIVLGTDGKLYSTLPLTGAVPPTPTVNVFSVSSGTSVTLTHLPLTSHHIQVFRNGMRQRLVADYTLVGLIVTFTMSFGMSGGATGVEEIAVEYYRA